MGLLDKIKNIFSNSKLQTEKQEEKTTTVAAIQTRYGKKLSLSSEEKAKLVASLTPREKETFFILLGGYSLKETAEQLKIGYSTVNTYQTAIYKKLTVKSRAVLIINYRDMCEIREE